MVEFIKIDGLSEYVSMIQLIEKHVEKLIIDQASESVYLVEHEEVYTAGTSAKACEFLLKNAVTPVVNTNRGGKFTYHGPGQRIIYPIIDLSRREKDIKLYIRMLEQWMINSLACFGVSAFTIAGKVGIWVRIGHECAKIGAIGVRVKKWVAYHGIAINIFTNLSKFNAIIPCGLQNSINTSLAELGVQTQMYLFDEIIELEFKRVFG